MVLPEQVKQSSMKFKGHQMMFGGFRMFEEALGNTIFLIVRMMLRPATGKERLFGAYC